MTGTFELFTDDNQYYRFRLTAPDGTVVALSQSFPDKATALAGIAAVRECAGMGLITDLCPHIPLHSHSGNAQPAARTTSQPSPAARPASGLPRWTAAGTSANPGRGTAGRDPRQHRAA
jgi:uncharacterized protein YegP (UPF0339 family)